MMILHGLSASEGVAVGYVHKKKTVEINQYLKNSSQPDKEIENMQDAREICLKQLDELIEKALRELGKEHADIFEAHKALVSDDCFFDEIENDIRECGYSAPWAVNQGGQKFIEILLGSEDHYIAERAADIRDVISRIENILIGEPIEEEIDLCDKTVIVAQSLTPSDTMQMDISKVIAFITEEGGKNSHVAIIARAAGIPAIVGAKGLCTVVNNGDMIALDAKEGLVFIEPDETTLEDCAEKHQQERSKLDELCCMIGLPTCTVDGVKPDLYANMGSMNELNNVVNSDAAGIGLFRTEFLFMNRDTLPSEDEQFEDYRKVAEAMGTRPVIIRTFDVGGDKEAAVLQLEKEENPFLGYRAIRICLDRPELFRTQLRAILRASVYGNIRIMIPMISGIEELRDSKKQIQIAKDELEERGLTYIPDIEVGIMIEVPSAAVMADQLAEEADFFSIGTNDLIQYTLAADRGNKKVFSLYTPLHPAVLRLVSQVIKSAHAKGIPVGMCGEAASDVRLIPVYLGMGLDEFSVSPSAVLRCRKQICLLEASIAMKLANLVLEQRTTEDVEKTLKEHSI